MAERRMFAKTIIDSDAFLDMPVTSRLLYYDLGMRADDDGFVNSPKKIMRMVGASEDDLRVLIARKFIIPFDNGVVVIKHWRINNYLRNDRHNETKYADEKEMLEITSNGAYRVRGTDDGIPHGTPLGIPSVSTDKVSIGKDSIDKDSIGKDSIGDDKPTRHRYGEYQNVLLTDEDYSKLMSEFPNDYTERIDRLSYYIKSTGKAYEDHLATIRNWARMDARKDNVPKEAKTGGGSNPFLNLAIEEGII